MKNVKKEVQKKETRIKTMTFFFVIHYRFGFEGKNLHLCISLSNVFASRQF